MAGSYVKRTLMYNYIYMYYMRAQLTHMTVHRVLCHALHLHFSVPLYWQTLLNDGASL